MARLVFAEKPQLDTKRYKIIRHDKGWRSVSFMLEPSTKEWWEDPDVLVAFNFPRISARLERLMGTNIVRLTDQKYMKELRERIEEDHRLDLQNRIVARELKEIERERLLIIDGKSDKIPVELAEDPIFVVNQAANKIIQKDRAKLKTNRERNSERLKLQGVRWERERLIHEEEERQRIQVLKERRKAQKELEEQYRQEDDERGMDLLRIHNEDWRPCEQQLKLFLENERAKMKARSLKVPTPYTSDPLDLQNIANAVKARQKFREHELRIRKELEEIAKKEAGKIKDRKPKEDAIGSSAISKIARILTDDTTHTGPATEIKDDLFTDFFAGEHDHSINQRIKYSDDDSNESSEHELVEQGSTISESKRKHAQQLDDDMENDVNRGMLISRAQYSHLRYEEDKIVQLRQAQTIRELYKLAEEIIIGERIEDELNEEEMGEEEEEPPMDDDDDEDNAEPAKEASKQSK